MDPLKPLPALPESIVSVLRSLARFMAEYLDPSKSELRVCAPLGRVFEWPSVRRARSEGGDEADNSFPIRIAKEKLVAQVTQKRVDGVPLSRMFSPDKAVELMLVTGLFDEAVYFLNCKNRIISQSQ